MSKPRRRPVNYEEAPALPPRQLPAETDTTLQPSANTTNTTHTLRKEDKRYSLPLTRPHHVDSTSSDLHTAHLSTLRKDDIKRSSTLFTRPHHVDSSPSDTLSTIHENTNTSTLRKDDLKRSSTVFTKTLKRIPDPRYASLTSPRPEPDTALEDFIHRGLKRSNTFRHTRSSTRYDTASIESKQSQSEKIKLVYEELEMLRRRNKELESRGEEKDEDVGKDWKEVEELTVRIMERLGVKPVTREELVTLEKEPVALKEVPEPEPKDVECEKVKAPKETIKVEPKREVEQPKPIVTTSESPSKPNESLFNDSSFLNDVLASFNF